jgi:tetratricopeptide (TPR) repeat protein
MKSFFFLLVAFLVFPSKGTCQLSSQQLKQIDSLKIVIQKTKTDSVKVVALFQWDDMIYVSDPVLDEQLCGQINKICENNLKRKLNRKEKRFFKHNRARVLNAMGQIAFSHSEFSKAKNYYKIAMRIHKELKNPGGIAKTLNSMGNIEYETGNYPNALKLFNECYKMCKKAGNEEVEGYVLNNMANTYLKQGDFKKAISCHMKSLKLSEAQADLKGVGTSYANIGNVYLETDQNDSAIAWFNKAYNLAVKMGDKLQEGVTLGALGSGYEKKRDFKKALMLYEKGLAIQEEMHNDLRKAAALKGIADVYLQLGEKSKAKEIGNQALVLELKLNDSFGSSGSYFLLADIYFQEGNYDKSIKFAEKALDIFKRTKNRIEVSKINNLLSQVYEKSGDYKEALFYMEAKVKMMDSLQLEEGQNEITRQGYQYAYEKKAVADSVKHQQENSIIAAQIKSEKTQRYVLFGGMGLVLLLAIFMVQRFRVTQKQSKVIALQKQVVDGQKLMIEEKQAEIIDSIHYAKRIQMALLPSEKNIDRQIEKIKNQ